ncbi:MAG: PAS domain S-box protein, partial [Geminicoccaceae bacterium]
MSDAVVLVDEHGIIDMVSQSFLRASGWLEEEIVGRFFPDLIAADQEGPVDGQSMASGVCPASSLMTTTRRYRCRDGSFFSGATVLLPVLSNEGHVSHCLHVIHSTPDRPWSGDDLNSLVAFLIESGIDENVDVSRLLELGCRYFRVELGLFTKPGRDGERIDAVGVNLASDASKQSFLKRSSSLSIRGNHAVLAMIDEDEPTLGTVHVDLDILLASPVKGAEQCYGSLYFAHRPGSEHAFDDCQQSILGLMTQWLAARMDAQAIRRSYQDANLRLRTSEERFRILYEKTPAMLHSIDASGRISSVSDAWLAAMGYERDEVIGRRSTDFLTAESRRYA